MRWVWILTAGVVGLGSLAYSGCREHKVVVVHEQPVREVVVEERPHDVIIVQQAPPPIIVERHGPPPGAGYVWIDGYYFFEHGKYVWRPGHFVAPPHRGAKWEADHWEKGQHGYRYVPGNWH